MSSCLKDDALEILRIYIAIFVFVEDLKSLSYSLALESAKHLGELGVRNIMAMLFRSDIQGYPLGAPIKRYSFRTFVLVV